MNFSSDETEDDETEDAVYECALAELLAEGVGGGGAAAAEDYSTVHQCMTTTFTLVQ